MSRKEEAHKQLPNQTMSKMPDNNTMIPLVNIDELEVPDGKFGFSILLCASTRAGKTSMMNYLYDSHFKKHITTIMSNSLQSDAYDHVKRFCILSDLYHGEMLKEMYQINHATENHYQFCVILDDLTNIKNEKEYLRLLTIYRNSRISCIVSSQGISMFNKTARGNINFVILGRLNSDAEVEKVVKEYCLSYFPRNMNLVEKITYYRKLTDDHFFLVLDQVNGKFFRTKLRPEQLLNK
jgi:hypothetical protein